MEEVKQGYIAPAEAVLATEQQGERAYLWLVAPQLLLPAVGIDGTRRCLHLGTKNLTSVRNARAVAAHGLGQRALGAEPKPARQDLERQRAASGRQQRARVLRAAIFPVECTCPSNLQKNSDHGRGQKRFKNFLIGSG
jgi:hypothetical protein